MKLESSRRDRSDPEVLGYRLFGRTAEECVDEVVEVISRGEASRGRPPAMLMCLNPHSYVVAKKDAMFRSALSAAGWLLPDGIGVVIAARLLGTEMAGRVTGSDIFEGLSKRLSARGGRVFFLGGTDAQLKEVVRRYAKLYPGVEIAGSHAPPFQAEFGPSDLAGVWDVINASRADILWVGLGAPKQEKVMLLGASRLMVPVVAGVGAVFDFFSGSVRRPSKLVRQVGLEWLPRLLREPGRLWRRTLVSAPIFAADVIRQSWSRFRWRK